MDESEKRAGAEEARSAEAGQDLPEGAVEIPVEVVEPKGQEAPETKGQEAPETEAAEAADEGPSREELLERLERAGRELEAERARAEAELLELRMRSQAELENFKKRLSREHDEHLRYAAEKVMKDIIPTLDNFELALAYGTRDEACASMHKGLEVTQKLLLDALGRHGLSRLGGEGEPFDPALQEAVGVEARPELPDGAVARVLQSGYQLNGRLLRPAKVNVNRRP